jgi:uncharacterized membrane protein YtjA (UPF0391 family)
MKALPTAGTGREEMRMLYWAAIFLAISIVAAVLGFGGISVAAASIAKILFFLFVGLFVLTLVIGLLIGRTILDR